MKRNSNVLIVIEVSIITVVLGFIINQISNEISIPLWIDVTGLIITVIMLLGIEISSRSRRRIVAVDKYTQQERLARLKDEKEKREIALVNADSAIKYIVDLLDQERQAQQEELNTLRDMVKPHPLQGFVTNFIWAILGVAGGIIAAKVFS